MDIVSSSPCPPGSASRTLPPWLLARPAVHPMMELADYFRRRRRGGAGVACGRRGLLDARGAGLQTPVVATAVGGMAVQLQGYASLTPRRDAHAMADAFLAIAESPDEARAQAQSGRAYVCREWSRDRAFAGSGVGAADSGESARLRIAIAQV